MKLYIDESGSITQVKNEKNRYFIVSFIETNNPKKASRIYKKSKRLFIQNNPTCNFEIDKEIKGSEMPNDMKKYIFNELRNKTDLKTHFIIFDNWHAEKRLLRKPSVAFNYLVFLKLFSVLKTNEKGDKLELKFDNRNCAVYGLNSLQEYLEIEFCLKKGTCSDIEVKYHDSDKKELIQIADIFSNTVFKACKFYDVDHPKIIQHYNNNVELMNILEKGNWEFFPRKHCKFDFIS